MMTLRQLSAEHDTIPTTTSWYLAELGEARGKQDMFIKQSPQKLKVLREHALIESAVSSNRIEGVEVEKSRINTLIFGKPLLRDRNEEEVRGYREALKRIHGQGANLTISEKTILELHRLCRGEIWDAGKYKEKNGDIIERQANGRTRIRFRTVPATEARAFVRELVALWKSSLKERWAQPLIAMAAFNLDFLCIHPFRDGNGRVSRLLLLLQCYQLGYEVGRYISLERLIEQNKERYYETLELSSAHWHEGKHDPWPYINYILFIIKSAYKEFEERLGRVAEPRGAKTELILEAISKMDGAFSIGHIQARCPFVSVEMIRKVLKKERNLGKIECLGRGRDAKWMQVKSKK